MCAVRDKLEVAYTTLRWTLSRASVSCAIDESEAPMTRADQHLPVCGICNKPVNLETSKADELGKAVHEPCYVRNIKQSTLNKSVFSAVIDFLNCASTPKLEARCPECGSPLEQRLSTFVFRGQSWEVPLPICPECNPILPLAIYCA